MKYFLAGLVAGVCWKDIKWLTYDLLKAISRGTYNACRAVCFGELKQGYSRWGALKHLPRVVWYEAGAFLKWEWLNGCKLGRS